MKKILLFLFILLVGLILRLHNISPFKIYPDSYQSLVVAENMRNYHSVVGYLGKGGMIYPDFFMWTRPTYPLLINIFTFFTTNTALIAQEIAFTSSILLIIVAFFFIRSIFKSVLAGITGSLFIALSFNLTVWGGFIMTETTGILLLVLFLWSLFATSSKTTQLASLRDFLTGFLFTSALLTRYEYAILAIPVTIWCLLFSKNGTARLVNIFSITLFFVVIVLSFLFPMQSLVSVIFAQQKTMLEIVGALFLVSFVSILIFVKNKKYFLQKKFLNLANNIMLAALLLFGLFLLSQFLIGRKFPFFYRDLTQIRSFITHDFLLSLFSFIGFLILVWKSSFKRFGLFCLLCIVMLLPLYHKINPEMERYMTHLVPFLLIPASYMLTIVLRKIYQLLKAKHYVYSLAAVIAVIAFVSLQCIFSYQGLRYTKDFSWLRPSYEEKSAHLIAKDISRDTTLIASLPEAYYFLLQVPTQSIADKYPFIYIDNVNENQTLLIIVDMPMRDIFPKFTSFVENNLQGYKVTQFDVGEKYHREFFTLKETRPVVLYEIKLKSLRQKIQQAQIRT